MQYFFVIWAVNYKFHLVGQLTTSEVTQIPSHKLEQANSRLLTIYCKDTQMFIVITREELFISLATAIILEGISKTQISKENVVR